MPKFHQSFYLSFLASNIQTPLFACTSFKKSFFSQKDKYLSRKYTIDMYSQHKRKSLLKDQIPFIRLNFPYAESTPTEWQVNPDKTNKEISDNIVKEALNEAGPFTRIYIDSGNAFTDEHLQQIICRPGDHFYNSKINASLDISYQDIAQLLSQSLPDHTKNNIQVKLIASCAENFTENLMK
ncbi:hypothetical protein Psal006b_02892 [Piscirickettsia salmonis]|uniref:Uncharacterized protein n=1 Tax=Piscirickettsia salmonis TaxID=1238 RepID=A0A1L6TGG8_PISSA|nr:hypothetical protein [Piscirickettsia salmonis]AKP72895.1 hypothetical protein PSLF89_811 [Piscirickettsia salmonis LF-89 = ATCC VR-1361]ALB21514.1 hypothetical protein KU39_330 [Piscirickettsia salmonis]ALY01730.1 hypothetical protein AWE47_01635 [Piscirickettsia salmonis]AMA41246.1 hypothetical protein AWJ11_01645 [Piscirickettsia salmonis]AOS36437.1 hypothetical protein AVM72_14630 [Piscirickettsia salmonis]